MALQGNVANLDLHGRPFVNLESDQPTESTAFFIMVDHINRLHPVDLVNDMIAFRGNLIGVPLASVELSSIGSSPTILGLPSA